MGKGGSGGKGTGGGGSGKRGDDEKKWKPVGQEAAEDGGARQRQGKGRTGGSRQDDGNGGKERDRKGAGGKRGGRGGGDYREAKGGGKSSEWQGHQEWSEWEESLQPRRELDRGAAPFQPSGLGGGYGSYAGYSDGYGGEIYGGGGAYGGGAAYGGWQPDAPIEPTQPIKQPPPPPLWVEYFDQDGAPYYYNSKSGLTQWLKPSALDPPEDTPAKSSGQGGFGRVATDGGRVEPRTRGGGASDGRDSGGRDSGGRDRNHDRDDDTSRSNRDHDDDTSRRGPSGAGDGGRGERVARDQRKPRGIVPKDGKKQAGNKTEKSDFGPPGCNLFVFHLPDDWVDEDLNEYFSPHGNVVSAKVMKELGTGRSRGFGFVSYEDRVAAATSVKKMQGYKILGKRLKVEFKKGEVEALRDEGIEMPSIGDDDDNGSAKKSFPDDERLIGYLRAISAKNVVQSLKENEAAEGAKPERGDSGCVEAEGSDGGDSDGGRPVREPQRSEDLDDA